MIVKIGFTSEEIKALPASALVEAEWLREIAYQLAKSNEQSLVLSAMILGKMQTNAKNTKRITGAQPPHPGAGRR